MRDRRTGCAVPCAHALRTPRRPRPSPRAAPTPRPSQTQALTPAPRQTREPTSARPTRRPAPTLDTGTDTGPTIDTPPVTDTGPTADTADAGAVDSGTDVVRVDGAPCIPACAAGQVCVGGVCEAVDGGADAGRWTQATADLRFAPCASRGVSVLRGLRGVLRRGWRCHLRAPEWLREDAGARGTCLRSCTTGVDAQCPEGEHLSAGGACVILCSGDGDCGDAGTRCRDYSIDRACL